MVTVDVVIFTVRAAALQVLLIRRGKEPFKDHWAIPGGFVEMDESLEAAALRELAEETGVTNVYLEQLRTYGEPKRDPRGRTITVAYFALVKAAELDPRAGDDAAGADWFSLSELPPLAFDHADILKDAHQGLQAKIQWTTAASSLLPRTFSLDQLQELHQLILGKPVHRGRLRRQMLSEGLLLEVKSGSAVRYRFKA
jgi:8-oxo-dGTP diphosphatase